MTESKLGNQLIDKFFQSQEVSLLTKKGYQIGCSNKSEQSSSLILYNTQYLVDLVECISSPITQQLLASGCFIAFNKDQRSLMIAGPAYFQHIEDDTVRFKSLQSEPTEAQDNSSNDDEDEDLDSLADFTLFNDEPELDWQSQFSHRLLRYCNNVYFVHAMWAVIWLLFVLLFIVSRTPKEQPAGTQMLAGYRVIWPIRPFITVN